MNKSTTKRKRSVEFHAPVLDIVNEPFIYESISKKSKSNNNNVAIVNLLESKKSIIQVSKKNDLNDIKISKFNLIMDEKLNKLSGIFDRYYSFYELEPDYIPTNTYHKSHEQHYFYLLKKLVSNHIFPVHLEPNQFAFKNNELHFIGVWNCIDASRPKCIRIERKYIHPNKSEYNEKMKKDLFTKELILFFELEMKYNLVEGICIALKELMIQFYPIQKNHCSNICICERHDVCKLLSFPNEDEIINFVKTKL